MRAGYKLKNMTEKHDHSRAGLDDEGVDTRDIWLCQPSPLTREGIWDETSAYVGEICFAFHPDAEPSCMPATNCWHLIPDALKDSACKGVLARLKMLARL